MELHKFMRDGKVALTDDKAGAKLPGAGWVFQKSLNFEKDKSRIGAPYDDVVKAIGDKGYFDWPESEANDA